MDWLCMVWKQILENNALIATIISIISLIVSVITRIKSSNRERKQITIDYYLKLQKHLYAVYEYPDEEIETYVYKSDSNEYKMLSACLAQLEIYAAGVKTKLFDFNVFYQLGHGYIDDILLPRFEVIIDIWNKKLDGEYYKNTIWLLNEMKKKAQKEMREKN